MELYPREESGKNLIESAGSTAEYQSYKIALRELQDKTNKLRDELKSNGICYTEEYNSLMAKIEAASNNSPEQAKLLEQLQSMTEEQQYAPEFLAERKRYQAERKATLLKIVSGEPSIARFSILARLMVYNLPDGEFIDVFKNIYAKAMPDNATTAFCHRQINGHNLQIGARYIDFEAPDLDGNMHYLSEMIDGAKIVMLDLWASWCAPCRKASMEMIPLYEQYKDKGFAIVGVARETGSTKAMKNAIKKDGYKWPQLVELDDSGNIWAKYGCINSGGRRILLDSDGRILAFDPTLEELTTIIEKNLGK
jgi:thiol-disulfide isomerase/thioredoxin